MSDYGKRLVVVFKRPPRKKEREWLQNNIMFDALYRSKDTWVSGVPMFNDIDEAVDERVKLISDKLKIDFNYFVVSNEEYLDSGFTYNGITFPRWSVMNKEEK